MKGPTIIQIPLVQGMNQSFGPDNPAAPPGTLYDTENLRINANGNLEKRWGMAGLAGNSATGAAENYLFKGNGTNQYVDRAPVFVTTVGDIPVIGDSNGVVFGAHNPTGYDSYMFAGGFFSTTYPIGVEDIIEQDVSAPSGTYQNLAAVARTATHKCTARIVGQLVQYTVTDNNNAGVFRQFKAAGTVLPIQSGKIRIAAVGENFVAVRQASGSALLARAITVDQSGVTSRDAADTPVGSLMNPAAYWDLNSYNGTDCFLAYQPVNTGIVVSSIRGNTLAVNGSATELVSNLGGNVPVSVFADPSNERVVLGLNEGPGVTGTVRWVTYNPTLTTVLGTGTVITGLGYGPPLFGPSRISPTRDDDRYFFALGNLTAGQASTLLGRASSPSDPGVITNKPTIWHDALPISKPDHKERVWLWQENAGATGTAHARAILLKLTGGLVGTSGQFSITLPNCIQLSYPTQEKTGADGPLNPTGFAGYFCEVAKTHPTMPDIMSMPLPLVSAKPSGVSVDFAVVDYGTLEATKSLSTLKLAGEAYAAGSPVELFARAAGNVNVGAATAEGDWRASRCREVGFVIRPAIVSISATVGPVVAGTRSYIAVFKCTVGNKISRSAPSVPQSITLGVTGGVSLSIHGSSFMQMRESATFDPVARTEIEIYRTVAAGTQYHLVGSVDNADSVDHQTFGDSVTFVDQFSDEQAATQPFLYTDGGVLENDIAPSCRFMAASEDRLWCGGLWQPEVIQASKIIVPGEQVAFTDSPAFQVALPEPCMGLAYQDGNIVAFAKTNIYVVSGSGPNDQGIGEFSPPRKITSGVGCINHASIVATNRGIVFQSAQGFYLLPRGFGPVEYIGAAVKNVMQGSGLSKCIASATLESSQHNTARFLMTHPTGTSGRDILTYDIDGNRWFRDTVPSANAMWGFGAWPGGYAACQANMSTTTTHPIWHERADELGDQAESGTPTATRRYVSSNITTERIYPFGPGGWGSINKVLATVKPAGNLQKLTITTQVDDYAPEVAVWTLPGSGSIEYRQKALVNRHGTSVVISVRDDDVGAGPSKGLSYLAIAVEVTPEEGVRLLKPSEQQ
jgi:hypothetical protein